MPSREFDSCQFDCQSFCNCNKWFDFELAMYLCMQSLILYAFFNWNPKKVVIFYFEKLNWFCFFWSLDASFVIIFTAIINNFWYHHRHFRLSSSPSIIKPLHFDVASTDKMSIHIKKKLIIHLKKHLIFRNYLKSNLFGISIESIHINCF